MSASLSRLRSFYGDLKIPLLLHAMITREFAGSVAILATGSEDTAKLLELVAFIDTSVPILSQTAIPNELGFTHITQSTPADMAGLIEDMTLLAVISDETRVRGERIELDADGVFRIYPFMGAAPRPEATSDWTV